MVVSKVIEKGNEGSRSAFEEAGSLDVFRSLAAIVEVEIIGGRGNGIRNRQRVMRRHLLGHHDGRGKVTEIKRTLWKTRDDGRSLIEEFVPHNTRKEGMRKHLL